MTVYAQTIIQSETKFYKQLIKGNTPICGLDLMFVFRDDVTGSAAPGGMSGSVSFAYADGALISMVKLSAAQGPIHVPVNSASLVADEESLPLKQSPCLNANTFCGVLINDQAVRVIAALLRNKLEIRYNLHPKDLDFAFPVSPLRADDPDDRADFSQCLQAMIDKTLQDLPRQDRR